MSYPITAKCEVSPEGKSCDGTSGDTGVKGNITFTQESADTCMVEYNIAGLTPGNHGFHIHELADFTNGCKSAGGHYNPHGKNHGAPVDDERHVGDLGNILADANGVAKGSLFDRLIKLSGDTSIIGRSVMVHAGEDDCGKGGNDESLKTGNAGGRVACGEILLVSASTL